MKPKDLAEQCGGKRVVFKIYTSLCLCFELEHFPCRTSTLLFACCLHKAVPWAEALRSVVGMDANTAFLVLMKYRRACRLSLHSIESIRKASSRETNLFYHHWNNYLQNTPPFLLGKTGMFCGTQQDLRDGTVTKSIMAGYRQMKGPLVLILVLSGLRTIAEVVMRPIWCLYATAWALISREVCSVGRAGLPYTLPGWRPPRHLGWREKWGWSNCYNKKPCYVWGKISTWNATSGSLVIPELRHEQREKEAGPNTTKSNPSLTLTHWFFSSFPPMPSQFSRKEISSFFITLWLIYPMYCISQWLAHASQHPPCV